ncbi:MAG: acetyltransferase [Zoogloeaceae bacterium]|nr:acetyltransferase [Zoogloeaceae bacterium]
MRQKLIVIGAGGLGRIVYDTLLHDESLCAQYQLAGFLDTRADVALPPELEGSILGDPLTWQTTPEEVYIPAIGNPLWRRNLLAPLILQGARFFSYTNKATIGSRTSVGEGVFFTPGAIVSTDCKIGAFSYIDTGIIIGHDVEIGEYCMIGAMCFLAGGVRIGHGVSMHPSVAIAKGVRIGDGATVGMGSVVLKDVPAHATVFGNPARIISVDMC